MILFEQLEAEVRHLAAEHPDFEYRTIGGCQYNADHEQPGCIFGQAFTNLGSPVPFGLEGENISDILLALDIDATDEQHRWVAQVQTKQDDSFSWRSAIRHADKGAACDE